MTMRFPRLLLVVLTVVLPAASARAQQYLSSSGGDVELCSYADRLSALEAEVASLRSRSLSSSHSCDGCDGCGNGCNDCCCGPSWYLMLEFPWLQVNNAGIEVPGLFATPTYGQEPSYRVVAGVEGANGLGFRLSAFDFEDSADDGLGPVGLASRLDIYAVDLELTQSAQLCSWDLLLFGGVRIAGIEQGLAVDLGGDSLSLERDFDGAGLTFGLGMVRPIGCSCLSFYSNMRGSLLFGDADVNVSSTGGFLPPTPTTVAEIPNQTIAVWEAQLGVQYERGTRFGQLFARVGVEAQLWEQPPVVLGLLDDNVGLFGPTFAVGLQR